MSKFTPGPWMISKVRNSVTVEGMIGENRAYLAHLSGNNPEANAKLIAAAPEMYDFLKRISEFAKTGQPLHWSALIGDSDEMTAEEELSALLSKARGEK